LYFYTVFKGKRPMSELLR